MKKKNILLIFSLALFGCEEVIEVDINSTDPQIIIEATLSNSNNEVRITQSTDFYDPNEYLKISNANVEITDQNGTSYVFYELNPGIYIHNNLSAMQKSNYTITVEADGEVYNAESYSPQLVQIDSLSYKFESRPFGDDPYLELHVHFQDPEDQSNYIRFVIYKNGKKLNGIFLYDDRLTNGNEIDFFFFNFEDDEKFRTGDEIWVEMQSIDQATHTYFRTLRRALARSSGGPFGPAAPSNPITNWDNDAFGYFSAFNYDSKRIFLE